MDLIKYTDIVIVDEDGTIIYFDISNTKMINLSPEEILGKNVTSLYKNLDKNNSTLIKAIHTGESTVDYKQSLKTKSNNMVHQTSSTYPIMNGSKVVGAIELSKYYYEKAGIKLLESHSDHLIYRKNNTIYSIDDIITKNEKMIAIKENIEKIASSNATVLIQGRTGTGKEMIAQAIHNQSSRRYAPFISLNCGAIPEGLLESILFGTVKGSFTGSENKEGLFELANNGTLFLDEINSLSLFSQAKLLKVIEEQKIRRVGSSKEIPISVRIIAASNEDVTVLIEKQLMREDLYYRLAVVQIDLPDLVDRREDIEFLSNYFIEYYNQKLCYEVQPLPEEVLLAFLNYDWPGNLRELKNVIEGVYNHIEGDIITLEYIPNRILQSDHHKSQELEWHEGYCLKQYIDNYERRTIMGFYNNNHFNLSKTAKNLGISKQLLRYKLDQYQKLD